MSMDLFVSHSSRDKTLVSSLVDLLKSALRLSSTAIRCTSLDGYGYPPGTRIEERLRQEVYDAEALICVISRASLKSTYVVYELGARWGAQKPMMPVLTGDITASELPEPISHIQVKTCENPSHLHELVSNIATLLNKKIEPPAAYQAHIEEVVDIARKYVSTRAVDSRMKEFAEKLEKEEKRLIRALVDDEGRITWEAGRAAPGASYKKEYAKALKNLMDEGLILEQPRRGFTGHALTEKGISVAQEYLRHVLCAEA